MLARDPAKRITAEEALRHPWLSDTSLARCVPLHRSISLRLRSFTRLQRLKRLLLNIVAQRLSQQQIRDLHNLFVALVSRAIHQDCNYTSLVTLPWLLSCCITSHAHGYVGRPQQASKFAT